MVIVEGATEESFVNNVLAPALWAHSVYATAVIIGVPGHKGGRVSYSRLSKDILKVLKQDRLVYCSTMVDWYGLGDGFPGHPPPLNLPASEKARSIEAGIYADIVEQIPEFQPETRFIPYIQLHEYEGLLFSDPQAFATAINRPQLSATFQKIRDDFNTPEDINDDPETAPSKRIKAACSYSKVIDGTKAAKLVGLIRMRAECPHFAEWVHRLENLPEL
ncbi:MAG: DUF4276 family protein [Bryobacteraceae bacterium]